MKNTKKSKKKKTKPKKKVEIRDGASQKKRTERVGVRPGLLD